LAIRTRESTINLGYVVGKDGKVKRKRKVTYGKTRREVAEGLKKALRDQQQGIPVVSGKETVEKFLTRWLDDAARPSLRPRTVDSYAMIVTHHLIPALGRIKLEKLTPQDVQSYMRQKSESGLSARTVQYHRAVLRKALNDGLR
jgi:hypothetical protein